jgi:hypothetical protein
VEDRRDEGRVPELRLGVAEVIAPEPAVSSVGALEAVRDEAEIPDSYAAHGVEVEEELLTRSWRGVRWEPVRSGKCLAHGEVGRFTGICWWCHREQLEAARRGSREWEQQPPKRSLAAEEVPRVTRPFPKPEGDQL